MVQGKDNQPDERRGASGEASGESRPPGLCGSSLSRAATSETKASKAWVWDRINLNFIIDALMFLVIMAMAGLGLLMKYVLLPGRQSWLKYGRNVNLTWWGWDRHAWGDLHFYLSLFFLGLLVLHIYLHWQQIVGLFQRLVPPPHRRLVLLVFLFLAIILIYFPFLITPEVSEGGRGMGRIPR